NRYFDFQTVKLNTQFLREFLEVQNVERQYIRSAVCNDRHRTASRQSGCREECEFTVDSDRSGAVSQSVLQGISIDFTVSAYRDVARVGRDEDTAARTRTRSYRIVTCHVSGLNYGVDRIVVLELQLGPVSSICITAYGE